MAKIHLWDDSRSIKWTANMEHHTEIPIKSHRKPACTIDQNSGCWPQSSLIPRACLLLYPVVNTAFLQYSTLFFLWQGSQGPGNQGDSRLKIPVTPWSQNFLPLWINEIHIVVTLFSFPLLSCEDWVLSLRKMYHWDIIVETGGTKQ